MMAEAVICVLTVLAAFSYPIAFSVAARCGFDFRMRLFHLLCFAAGVLIFASDAFLLWRASGAVGGDTMEWARDFFFGYARISVVSEGVIVLFLTLSAAIGHKMKRTYMALVMLLPIITASVTFVVASTASGGDISVDTYIRILAPAEALLVHIAPACTRSVKSPALYAK